MSAESSPDRHGSGGALVRDVSRTLAVLFFVLMIGSSNLSCSFTSIYFMRLNVCLVVLAVSNLGRIMIVVNVSIYLFWCMAWIFNADFFCI